MIAMFLSTAALIWNVQPAQPVNVVWDQQACGLAYACSVPNSYRINLNPGQWGSLSGSEQCAVVTHEYGHAVVGTLWTDADVNLPIPYLCERFDHPLKGVMRLNVAVLQHRRDRSGRVRRGRTAHHDPDYVTTIRG